MPIGDSLRAFVKAARVFEQLVVTAWSSKQFIWAGKNPHLQKQAEDLISAMQAYRQEAVVDGASGNVISLESMGEFVQSCFNACANCQGWEGGSTSDTPRPESARSAFGDTLQTLEDRIAYFDRQDRGKNGGDEELSPIQKVVLEIIEAEPDITVPDIEKRLKERKQHRARSTLYTHIIRALKAKGKIVNNPLGDGYRSSDK